jgi:hypothetical protein
MSDEPEYQHATVELEVVFEFNPQNDDDEFRKKKICRRFRLGDIEGINIKSPLLTEDVELGRVESAEEYGERMLAEAEGEHLRRIEEQKERYFDRNGYF